MTYEARSLIGACLCVVAAGAFAANFASDNLGSGKFHRVKSGKSFRLFHGSGTVLLLN